MPMVLWQSRQCSTRVLSIQLSWKGVSIPASFSVTSGRANPLDSKQDEMGKRGAGLTDPAVGFSQKVNLLGKTERYHGTGDMHACL